MAEHLTPEALARLTPIERVTRFLDERARPMPFAPEGFLPVDHIAFITRTNDSLLASDLRAIVTEVTRLREELPRAYDDGYNDAATMARCYGLTDPWPDDDEPRNPYLLDGATATPTPCPRCTWRDGIAGGAL